jgi:3-dehydroquinate dehydratase-2
MHIAVLNGPNINRLGKRKPERYGTTTLPDIIDRLESAAAEQGIEFSHFQSNHEGEIVDWLHENQDRLDGIVINPAGLTPYGRSLLDALSDTELPYATVHITQFYRHYGNDTQDLFREKSSVYVCGLGWRGYEIAMTRIAEIAG